MQRPVGPARRGRTIPSLSGSSRTTVLPLDSLAFALLGAARVCVGVRDGRTLRDGLEAERRAIAAPRAARDREPTNDPQAAIHDLAARALRRRGRSDALLASIGRRVPEPPLLRELLIVSIALVVDALAPTFAGDATFDARVADLPYSAFTLVDQAVRAAASEPELARGKGFVNAVLRTLWRQIEEDPAPLQTLLHGDAAPDVVRYELPSWWVTRLRDAYPSTWLAFVDASLENPPLVVRVNRRRTTRDDYLERLAQEGIIALPLGNDAVRFARPLPVARVPGFLDGDVSVQDEAAQRAAPLLDVRDGMRVLDACAAPGGKTGHLLELADVEVVAIDADAGRLARVRENLDRLGLAATLLVGDAAQPKTWWDGRPFDRILADVPCTASGILRRHPDIRWLRREDDIRSLSRSAQQITGALWSLLTPGGKFLLVTCSIFPEESRLHAASFAAAHPDARVLAAPGQLMPSHRGISFETAHGTEGNDDRDHDGLFFALFEKMR